MTAAERSGRLDYLRRLLSARENQEGFKRNVDMIKAEIARLEAEAQDGD